MVRANFFLDFVVRVSFRISTSTAMPTVAAPIPSSPSVARTKSRWLFSLFFNGFFHFFLFFHMSQLFVLDSSTSTNALPGATEKLRSKMTSTITLTAPAWTAVQLPNQGSASSAKPASNTTSSLARLQLCGPFQTLMLSPCWTPLSWASRKPIWR